MFGLPDKLFSKKNNNKILLRARATTLIFVSTFPKLISDFSADYLLVCDVVYSPTRLHHNRHYHRRFNIKCQIKLSIV
jgi:hypothetical protein